MDISYFHFHIILPKNAFGQKNFNFHARVRKRHFEEIEKLPKSKQPETQTTGHQDIQTPKTLDTPSLQISIPLTLKRFLDPSEVKAKHIHLFT